MRKTLAFNLRLGSRDAVRLDAVAKSLGVSRAEAVRRLIREAYDALTPEEREEADRIVVAHDAIIREVLSRMGPPR